MTVGISLSTLRGSEGYAGSVGGKIGERENQSFYPNLTGLVQHAISRFARQTREIVSWSFMDCKGVEGWGGWDLLPEEGLESDSGPFTITKFVFLYAWIECFNWYWRRFDNEDSLMQAPVVG